TQPPTQTHLLTQTHTHTHTHLLTHTHTHTHTHIYSLRHTHTHLLYCTAHGCHQLVAVHCLLGRSPKKCGCSSSLSHTHTHTHCTQALIWWSSSSPHSSHLWAPVQTLLHSCGRQEH